MSDLQHQRIDELCQQFRLDRIASEWPALAQKAIDDTASFGDFLEQLLKLEAVMSVGARRCYAFLVCQRSRRWNSLTSSSPAVPLGRRYRSWPVWHSSNGRRTSCSWGHLV